MPQCTAPSARDNRPRHFDYEMQDAGQALAVDNFYDGATWHINLTDTSTKGKDRENHKRKLDVLEPESPSKSNRPKLSGNAAIDRTTLSSPMFVPLTPGSLASPARDDDAKVDDPPLPAIALPRIQIHPKPALAAATSHSAVKPDGGRFVNVHSMAQPVDTNKGNETRISKASEENDALRKLREWLGDCVEWE
jgi:hypothetical protein